MTAASGVHAGSGSDVSSGAGTEGPETATYLLESEALALRISPAMGGKVVSLKDRASGEEWLLPPLRGYTSSRRDGDFSESDGGGFDECLPGVAESPGVPDHGEVWRLPWRGGIENGALVLEVETSAPRLRLRRSVSIEGRVITMRYEAENLEHKPASFLWSAHPLLIVEPGDRVLLPAEIKSVRVEYSAGDRLRLKDDRCTWPVSEARVGNKVDLSRVGAPDGKTAEKLFAGPFQGDAWCALYRARLRQGIVFRFDATALPFVGLWICHGAWPATGENKQYTVAIEPTTSNCDSLQLAEQNGTARSLSAGEGLHWTMKIEVGAERDEDLDAFAAKAGLKK